MSVMNIRHITSRILCGLGYFSYIFQWLWIAVIALPPLIRTEAFDSFMTPDKVSQPVQIAPVEPSPLVWGFAIVVMALVFTATIITLIRLPRLIVRSGDKVVARATTSVVPVLTHHKVLPAKKRRQISNNVKLALQMSLAVVPLAISLFLPPYRQLSSEIIVTLALVMAIFSIGCFAAARLIMPQQKTTSRTRSHAFRG